MKLLLKLKEILRQTLRRQSRFHFLMIGSLAVAGIGLGSSKTMSRKAYVGALIKKLNYGAPFPEAELFQNYLTMSDDELIEQLMESDRFALTVLDFNLYFMGFPSNQLEEDSLVDYARQTINKFGLASAYEHHAALASAVAVARGGDYFDLFLPTHPESYFSVRYPPNRYSYGYQFGYVRETKIGSIYSSGNFQYRSLMIHRVLDHLGWDMEAGLILNSKSDAEVTKALVDHGRRFLQGTIDYYRYADYLGEKKVRRQSQDGIALGFGVGQCQLIADQMTNLFGLLGLTQNDWSVMVENLGNAFWNNNCVFHAGRQRLDPKAMPIRGLDEWLANLEAFQQYMNEILDGVERWPMLDVGHREDQHPIQHIWLDAPQVIANMRLGRREFFGEPFYRLNQNTNTNFNRHRAKTVLKQFFCDDLTPVQVLASANHMESKHASDPACFACHYKLDPMAGFFRYRGVNGTDYEPKDGANPWIVFDNNVAKSGQEALDYFKSWLMPGGSSQGETWNVGFVKSTQYSSYNLYGSSLSDLVGILRTAPEVKRCLVKNMASYFVSPNRLFDLGYIDKLTDELEQDMTEVGGTAAFKNTVKKLLKSHAFRAVDVPANTCLDFASDVDPRHRAPCEIAAILEKNCTGCHGSSDNPYLPGNLSFSTWLGNQFFHVNPDTHEQYEPKVTACRMVQRLSSRDPSLRMPQGGGIIDSTELQKLIEWATPQIGECNLE